MRRAWWLAVVVVSLVVGASAAQAEVAMGQATTLLHPTLTVSGSGTVQVSPDTVRIAASVVTEGPTVAEARDRNAEIATRSLQAVAALKLPNLASKTVDYTIERVTREVNLNMSVDLAKLDIPWKTIEGAKTSNVNMNFPITLGYRATNSVTVRVQGLPREELSAAASKIIDALMAAGCNQITSVTYSLEQSQNEAQRDALAKAMRDAQLTAETVAKAAGRTIVGIRSISPNYYRALEGAQAYNAAGVGGGGGATPFTAGLLQVTAQVQVYYELNYNPGDTQVIIGGTK